MHIFAVQSLNGLQMENTVSGLDGSPLPEQRGVLGSHAKLERQGSKGSKGCSTPSHKLHSPLGNRMETDRQNDDLHGLLSMVGLPTLRLLLILTLSLVLLTS